MGAKIDNFLSILAPNQRHQIVNCQLTIDN